MGNQNTQGRFFVFEEGKRMKSQINSQLNLVKQIPKRQQYMTLFASITTNLYYMLGFRTQLHLSTCLHIETGLSSTKPIVVEWSTWEMIILYTLSEDGTLRSNWTMARKGS